MFLDFFKRLFRFFKGMRFAKDCVYLTIIDGVVVAIKPYVLNNLQSDYNELSWFSTIMHRTILIHSVENLKHLVEKQKLHYLMCSSVFRNRIKSIKNPALSTLMHRVVMVESMYAYAFTNIVFDKDTTDSYMEDWLTQNR